MRSRPVWLLSVRRSLPLFLLIVVCLAIWQVWLTWRLIEQGRNLTAQRSRERLEQVADLAVAQLSGLLADWDLSLRELTAIPSANALNTRRPPGTILVLVTAKSVAVYPPQPLIFVPVPAAASAQLQSEFEAAERLEFRDEKYDRALELLRPLTVQPATRREAWLRIARLERKLNHSAAALVAYEQISREAVDSPSGVPYGLLATGARCQMLLGTGDPSHAAKELESLRTALLEGRWPLQRETFEFYWEELNRMRQSAEEPPPNSLALANVVERLHQQWQRAVRSGSSFSGREAKTDSPLLLWHAAPARLAALYASRVWLAANLKLPANASDIRWNWIPAGGQPGGTGTHITRSLAEAQIEGRLDFTSVASPDNAGLSRRLLLAGVALMLLVVLGGAYAIHRGVSRELRVAQLQSDFVSTVSHEFRSPLTTIRTISELLAHGRIAEEARREQSYVFLERETGRLHRLVEDLLDFGRMESGRKQYHLEAHDAFAVVRSAVADFREQAAAAGFEIEMRLDSGAATVEADEEAVRRALRNLLENAVKYSPQCRTVWVEGALNQRQVMISVRDRGIGIEPREQRKIFQRFVRGVAARKAGIKGTGIGLAMVSQIIDACGGQIRLQSAAGAGSTFTIVLPLIRNGEGT